MSHSLSDVLTAELGAHARTDGANAGLWRDAVVYRFNRPTSPCWNAFRGPSIWIIVRPAQAQVRIGGRLLFARSSCVLLDSPRPLDCDIIGASFPHPVLVLAMGIDPLLIRTTIGTGGATPPAGQPEHSSREVAFTDLDDELADIVVRFVSSWWDPDDRRIVAPLHLTELVYRLKQRNRRGGNASARGLSRRGPMAAVIDYISGHLCEPLTVDVLAAQACLSASAFSRAFRDLTGQPPYQYVKTKRMERARLLLDDGRLGVADVAHAVGYTNVSHFIREYRARFGITPGKARTSADWD